MRLTKRLQSDHTIMESNFHNLTYLRTSLSLARLNQQTSKSLWYKNKHKDTNQAILQLNKLHCSDKVMNSLTSLLNLDRKWHCVSWEGRSVEGREGGVKVTEIRLETIQKVQRELMKWRNQTAAIQRKELQHGSTTTIVKKEYKKKKKKKTWGKTGPQA